MPELDPVLRLLLLLKNNWNLTGDFTGSNIAFTTRWYDTNIMLPQITITPLGSSEIPLTTGNQPIYRFGDAVGINIWVRPKQDSNTSIGWAKNAVYQLRKEIDRILMTGSRLASSDLPEELVDSYSEEHYDFATALQALHPSASGYRSSGGQCFTTPSYGSRIVLAKFYLKKTGSPIGNAHAVLYAMTGTYGTDGKPTGSALATSDGFDVSTLTTSNQLITFTFTGAQQYVMQPNTHYCIAYENPTTGTIDASNYVSYGVDTFGDATHSGNEFLYFDSSYTTYAYDDAIFYVYGTPVSTKYEQFASLGGWRQLDELNRRPVIFRTQKTVVVNYFRDQVI